MDAQPLLPVLVFLGKMASGWWCCRRAPPASSFSERSMMGAAVGLRLPEKSCEPLWWGMDGIKSEID